MKYNFWERVFLPVVMLALLLLYFVAFAQGQTFFEASDVTDMTGSSVVASGGIGGSIYYLLYESGYTTPSTKKLGSLRDDGSTLTYSDETEFNTQTRVWIWYDSDGAQTNPLPSGYYVTATFNNGTAQIYLPTIPAGADAYYYLATKFEADGYYYVSTYNDAACTSLAQGALAYSPTPTPSVTPTPTPSVTPTPTTTATPTIAPTATPEKTPTPEVTPTASPVCAGATAYYAWDITDVIITTPRASAGFSMQYNIIRSSDSTSYGTIYDNNNGWIDGDDSNYGAVAIKISGTQVEVHDGDSLQITSGGVVKFVFFPNVWAAVTLYVGADGSTYYDATLCDLAKSSTGAKTPTPTPVTTPTPFAGQCLEYTYVPFTASQTALWLELNTSYQEIEAVLNGGITGYCLDPEFSIGRGQVGDDVIGTENLRDDAVTAKEVLNETLLGGADGNIAPSTLTAFNVNTTIGQFDFKDVFPGAYEIALPYMSSWGVYEPKWQWDVLPYWHKEDKQGGLRLNWRTETDAWGETIIYVSPEDRYVGIKTGVPAADLDVGGTLRVQGVTTFDRPYSAQWNQLSVNNVAPVVGTGMRWYSNNDAATLITTFNGGVDGQEIILFVEDGFTTFTETGNINFSSAAYASAVEGDVFRFVRRQNQWYEISRHQYAGYTPSTGAIYATDNFDNGQAGGTGWAGAWSGSGNVSLSTTAARSGSYSAVIKRNGYIYRGITVPIGQSVDLSFWSYRRSSSQDGTGVIQVFQGTGAPPTTTIGSYTVTDGWSRHTATFALMTGGPTYIEFKNGSAADSRAWIDDITID